MVSLHNFLLHKERDVRYSVRNFAKLTVFDGTKVRIKEILLEFSFIEEIITTRGNKQVPQTFFHNFPYSQKCVLICLTPYNWQVCISQLDFNVPLTSDIVSLFFPFLTLYVIVFCFSVLLSIRS